ncbi:MAG: imidazole glycerol phosphate synthase subunit HisH [Desulfobacterales bacterium]|nr:imidazole glycerol phosphate synthase subunit HisH [Desulfobacterales bacterium]
MTGNIGILEYGCGNIRSVKNALIEIGLENAKIIRTESDLETINKLIFPGVGAFDSVCKNLEGKDLFRPLNKFICHPDNKVLGICLGMQVLCTDSQEGEKKGLGLVDASVKFIGKHNGIKVPHMGWNTVSFIREDPLLEGLGNEQDFYFVHSYCVIPNNQKISLGVTDYGQPFTSIFRNENVWGVQFHPEKSQAPGLKILSNFLRHA